MSQNPIQNKLAYFSQGATYRTKKTEGDLSDRSIAFVGDDMSIATQGKIFGVRGVYPGQEEINEDEGNTSTKIITTEPLFPVDTNGRPLVGTTISVRFRYTNSYKTAGSNMCLNVNGTGAYNIYYNGSDYVSTTSANTTFCGYANREVVYTFRVDVVSGVEHPRWVFVSHGYESGNTNTIGYQLRHNSSTLPASDKFYRYRLLFTSADGEKYVPANTSSSTNATASRTVNQRPIDPFGEILYYGSTSSVSAGSNPGATVLWEEYTLSLGYSFNRTGATLVLSYPAPVYIKCTPNPNSDGSAIIDADTPYVQSLPSTNDGKIYIFLGIAYSATSVELMPTHPVYYYDGTGIRIWTGKNIPSRTSELTNDSGFIDSTVLNTALSGKQDKPIEFTNWFEENFGQFSEFPTAEETARTLTTEELAAIQDIQTNKYNWESNGTFTIGYWEGNVPYRWITPFMLGSERLVSCIELKKTDDDKYWIDGAYNDFVFSEDLATVATSGSYNDLSDKPNIPTVPNIGTLNTNNSTAQTTSSSESFSSNINLHKVSKTGSYNDLLDKPTINDGILTIKQNGNSRGTFTANQAGNSEADIISIVYGKYTSDGFKQGFPNLNNGWSYLSSPIELETGVLYVDVTTKKVYYYSGLGSTTTGLQEIFSPDLTTYENVQADWDEPDNTSDAYIWNKPAIPTVGTLNTNNTSALTESSSESFSGNISLHKVSKTGSYNDLLNKPTIPTIPDHKTLDGVSLVGSTGDVDKIVFGKLNANGSFTRYGKVGNEWAMVNVPTNPTARILYIDVFTELSYYYDTVVSQYKLIGPNPDLSGFLTSETPLSMGTTTGNGNAVTDISVSGHQITLTKGTTFLTASNITGKADKSAAIGSLSLSLNTTDYKITLTGTYVDGTPFTVSDVIDLPLESVVVSGSYDPSTKKVVLTLKNNSTIEFSIADLISGLQSEITSNNKLSADLVEDGTTNKVYTATEQTKLSGIEAGAEVNVQPDWNQTNTSADDYVKNKPTLDDVTITGALSKIVYGKKNSSGFIKGTRNNNGQGFTWLANNVTPEEHVLYIDITNYKGWYYEGGSYRQLHELNLSPYENVQADWNETDDSSDAYIWNKPTIPSAIEIIDLT